MVDVTGERATGKVVNRNRICIDTYSGSCSKRAGAGDLRECVSCVVFLRLFLRVKACCGGIYLNPNFTTLRMMHACLSMQ